MTDTLHSLSIDVKSAQQGIYSLYWPTNDKLKVVPSLSPVDIIIAGEPVLNAESGVEISTSVPARIYFHLFSDDAHRVVAERAVPLPGSSNFRDLGGYRVDGVGAVKWGHIFRSGKMSALAEEGDALWESLAIEQIIDFRSDRERIKNPSQFPGGASPDITILEIEAGNTTELLRQMADRQFSVDFFSQQMEAINRSFVVEHQQAFRDLLAILVETPRAAVFHCSAGKDRTGYAAAIVLTALGVNQQTVLADYLLSGQYFIPEKEYHWFRTHFEIDSPLEDVIPLFEVRHNYLDAAFKLMIAEYGSVEQYFAKILGVTPAMRKTLQQKFLFQPQ